MSSTVYENAIESVLGKNLKSSRIFAYTSNNGTIYHCNILREKFDNWIENNSGL